MNACPAPRKKDFFYAIYVGCCLLFLFSVAYLFLSVLEKFFVKDDRPLLWRITSRRVSRIFLNMAGIKVQLPEIVPDPQKDVAVYVSNHPTLLDGFVYISALGPHVITLSAPLDSFRFPFNKWFRKCGIVDVRRDDYDETRFKNANTKKEALDKLVSSLEEHNTSVFIFPEGHTEQTHGLHYIHTGAVRIAIRAQKPVVICTIVGMKKIVLDKNHMRPGVVRLSFGEKIMPPVIGKQLPFSTAVKTFSNELRDRFVAMLPTHCIPLYIRDRQKKISPASIGIFVDIDNTLYRGYSQKHFVHYLMKNKRISRFTLVRVSWYLFLEKIGLLTHLELMERALSFTKGWKQKEVETAAELFFKEQVVPNLYHNMLPPLVDHKKFGHTIFFVTEVIEPLAKQFKEYFKATGLCATLLEKTKSGEYTGHIKRLCKGDEKKKAILALAKKYKIDLAQSYAYGDAISDIPMLSSVRYACAVNPQKELEDEAHRCHWEILH